jgi:Methyltransferase domain
VLTARLLPAPPSYSAMPRLAAGEASFGLIFVDGDHQAEAVRHDVGWALRLLAPGGVLACHDYGEDCCCPGVRQALDELFPEGGEMTNSLFGCGGDCREARGQQRPGRRTAAPLGW